MVVSFGALLYNSSSVFLIKSISFLLGLLRIVVMALLQSVGISGIDGGLSSLRTSEAIIGSVVFVAALFEVAC